jgi:hypothetical protein
MRITIEDLEALKELSDEMEENHLETEKALQEDLGRFIYHVIQYELSVGGRHEGYRHSRAVSKDKES